MLYNFLRKSGMRFRQTQLNLILCRLSLECTQFVYCGSALFEVCLVMLRTSGYVTQLLVEVCF